MRLAALADIHGNLRALEAVITDLRDFAPDAVVNLGDHVSGPLEAAASCDLIMSHKDWISIRGNHDRQVIASVSLGLSDAAARQQLNDRHLAWLMQLAATAELSPDILLCHGTPESDTEYLLEEVSASGVTLATHDAVRMLIGTYEGLVLCGHSHAPRVVRLNDGTLCVNPGSVGLQAYNDSEHRFPHAIENGSPHSRYMLLDRGPGGWSATLRTVVYDWDAASRTARQQNRPDWAHALATGYAPR
jgi:putative phosphoesterase